jgi:hypothetical protein
MRRKKSIPEDDIFSGPLLPVPKFGAAEVASILEMESWRLQKFLSGKTYQLSSQGRIGQGGQGSRRLFNIEDIYRIGIADFLTKDGFGPKVVSSVLERIEDQDLFGFDSEGQMKPPPVIIFRREGKKRVLEFGSPKRGRDDELYYVLNTSRIIDEVDRRVREAASRQRS